MITTSMFRRQVWMTDDNELDHILENSQRVLGLSAQYENHRYVEEFTKQCNVMFIYGTYALEGEADSKFSLGDIWNLFQEDPLPNNASNFCRQMINCMRAWNYLQKTSDLPLNIEIIKQTHKIMVDGVEEYKKYLYLQAIIFLHQPVILEDIWKKQFLNFMKLKKMIQLWPLQICLEILPISIYLKMEMEEFVP